MEGVKEAISLLPKIPNIIFLFIERMDVLTSYIIRGTTGIKLRAPFTVTLLMSISMYLVYYYNNKIMEYRNTAEETINQYVTLKRNVLDNEGNFIDSRTSVFDFSKPAITEQVEEPDIPKYNDVHPVAHTTTPKVKTLGNHSPQRVRAIKRFAALCVNEYVKGHTPQLPSVKLAQLLVESNDLTSNMFKKTNNMFGIKCFDHTNHIRYRCMNFHDDHKHDKFRVYKTPWESLRDHSLFIANRENYKQLYKTKDYVEQCKILQKRGYATNGSYADILISTIEKYNLHLLDKCSSMKEAQNLIYRSYGSP